jgi:hypothetical protein
MARTPPSDAASALRDLVGGGFSWLPVSAVSAPLKHELGDLAAGLARLDQEVVPGSLVPLGSRRLAGEPTALPTAAATTAPSAGSEPRSAATADRAWSSYAQGSKERLSQDGESLLQDAMARFAADPDLAATDGSVTRYQLREILDQLGVPEERAAFLFLDDLLEGLVATSAKRFDGQTLPQRSTTLIGTARSALNKPGLLMVFPEKETAATRGGDLALKSDGAADGDLAVEEAKEMVRLVERLLDLARQYTVDLVGVVERYREAAHRMVREAQNSQLRRQLANDKLAIERAFAQVDSRQVARDLAALPLYLHRAGGEGPGAVGTALIPGLANPNLQRSFARLCLHLLRSPGSQDAAIASTPASAEPGDTAPGET